MKLFGYFVGLTTRRKILLATLTGLVVLSIASIITVVIKDKRTDKAQPTTTVQTPPLQPPITIQPKTLNAVGGVSLPEEPQ